MGEFNPRLLPQSGGPAGLVAEPPPGFLAAVSGLSSSDGATGSDYHAGRSFRRKRYDARRCSQGLTRIRLQLATYFCLHRGSFTESTATGQPRLRDKTRDLKNSVKPICHMESSRVAVRSSGLVT